MDLRTFLKPDRPPIGRLPRLGEPAPPLPGRSGSSEHEPFVIAFLRHVGCPFAEATARDLAALRSEPPTPRRVAVSHGTPEATRVWWRRLGFDRDGALELVHDPEGRLYALWGFGLTSVRHFAGLHSLRAVARLAARGIVNRHPSGSRWQSAGAFAVDTEGVVRWRHVPVHAGDLPDFAAAVRSLTYESHLG